MEFPLADHISLFGGIWGFKQLNEEAETSEPSQRKSC